jgi:murein DD-endopeptidase MepM/ murein hydrolase activator NlpD
MNKKRIFSMLSVILAAILLCSTILPLSAETVEEKKAALQEKIDSLNDEIKENEAQISVLKGQIAEQEAFAGELNAQIAALQSQIDALEQKMAILQTEIDTLNATIKEKSDKIIVLEEEIKKTEDEIIDCEEEIEQDYEILKTRIRSLYMNGTVSEIEVLFSSEDLTDFLIILELLNGISRHDTAIIEEIKAQIVNLDIKKATLDENKVILEEEKALLEEEKAEIEAAKAELQEDQAVLDATQSQIEKNWMEVNAIIAQLDQQSDTFQSLVTKAEAEKAKFAAQIDALVYQRGSYGTGTSASGFVWPLQYPGVYISCYYGKNGHGGTDITMPAALGKNVSCVADGVVLISGWHWSYGNYIVVDHGNGLSTYYAHNLQNNVVQGQQVKQNQVIALLGSTGNSTGPHIHFEVRVNGSRRNPELYLP